MFFSGAASGARRAIPATSRFDEGKSPLPGRRGVDFLQIALPQRTSFPMKTDELFYELFRFSPDSLLELIQLEVRGVYRFESITGTTRHPWSC